MYDVRARTRVLCILVVATLVVLLAGVVVVHNMHT